MTDRPGPSYQHVADDIRDRIRSGEYEVGHMIPSTPKLCEQYHASKTVIRTAVDQLRNAGIVVGHPGKGVYVKARPEDAAGEQRDLDALGKQVVDLRDSVSRLVRKFNEHGHSDLHEILSRIENNLIELYSKAGFAYPADRDDARTGKQRHSRAARA